MDQTEDERELDRQLRQKRDTLNKPNEVRNCIWYIRGDKLFKMDKKSNAGTNGEPTEGANGKLTEEAKGKPTEGTNGKPTEGANG